MKNREMEEIRGLAEKVATEKFAKSASDIDHNRIFPWDNMRTIGEVGFNRLIVSEKDGVLGFDRASFASAVKEIARACASMALIYVSHSIVEKAVELFGGEDVKRKWLSKMLDGQILGAFAVHEPDSGSNAGAITTRAIKDGNAYVVNGSKFFITSAGEASVYLVLARSAKGSGPQGFTTLLIEKDTPGLSFGQPEDKMGLTSTSSRQMSFDDCRVPVESVIGMEGQGTELRYSDCLTFPLLIDNIYTKIARKEDL